MESPSPSSPTESSAASEGQRESPPQDERNSSFEKWLVRIFLFLAFGVAFGIEGMTLFRSYVLDRNGDDAAAVEETAPSLPTLRVGDELLPASAPAERIERLAIEAAPGDIWTFRMEVALQNATDRPYELTTFGVLTQSGQVHEAAFQVACPPGDSARLVARWQLAASDVPKSLVASGRTQVTPDSAVVYARRFQLPRIPVQMVR